MKQPVSKMTSRVAAVGSGVVDWYTPAPFVAAVRAVFGGVIDLDPASSRRAQKGVKAKRYYTPRRNGLVQPWFGNVFLNPPYRCPDIHLFTARMVQAWQSHEIEAGILLTNASPDTTWFHQALNACTAVCLTKGRIRFLELRNGCVATKQAPTLGSAFFFFGDDTARFAEVFAEFGTVIITPTMQEAA
jgi:hypothetical protein